MRLNKKGDDLGETVEWFGALIVIVIMLIICLVGVHVLLVSKGKIEVEKAPESNKILQVERAIEFLNSEIDGKKVVDIIAEKGEQGNSVIGTQNFLKDVPQSYLRIYQWNLGDAGRSVSESYTDKDPDVIKNKMQMEMFFLSSQNKVVDLEIDMYSVPAKTWAEINHEMYQK
jgi:hypothetical protein